MSFRRYEITLPTRFPDGAPVGGELFVACWAELATEFGAVTIECHPVREIWSMRGEPLQRDNLRLWVDVEDTAETAAFFRSWKQVLKERFRQIDIWIVSYELQIT